MEEIKADSFARDLGLGNSMIKAIEIMKDCHKKNPNTVLISLFGNEKSNENPIKDFDKRISALQP